MRQVYLRLYEGPRHVARQLGALAVCVGEHGVGALGGLADARPLLALGEREALVRH